jgi:hypothetical protein
MSAVLDAKKAVLDALATRAALRGTQRELAHPGKFAEPEIIFLGVTRASEDGRALGVDKRRETFTIEVIVSVEEPGSDAGAVEGRAWRLYGEVEAAIVADPSLSGTVLMSGFSSFEGRGFVGDETRAFEVVADLECIADK